MKGSITHIREAFKSSLSGKGRDIVVLTIIILSASGAFALGRLSALESGEFLIEQKATAVETLGVGRAETDVVQEVSENISDGVGQVVASKSGSKYHYPWCAGARSIKDENKIYFETKEAARTAGYTPAANCKGLK